MEPPMWPVTLTTINGCKEFKVPLLPEPRRENALPKFRYRDVMIRGDPGQLPPASPDAQVQF
eukprot:2305428-Karenia_brevis.AAC.1